VTNIWLENQANSAWGTIVLFYKEKRHKFPYHIATREIFNDDPKALIRGKCMALIAITPLITIVRSIYWFAKSIFVALSVAFHYLDGQSLSEESLDAFHEAASDSVRALSYGILLMGCAFAGMFVPNWGRQHYGQLERELNRHSDGPHRDKIYLAICFQRLALMPDDFYQNGDQVEKKLSHYLSRIDAIRTAIWECSYQQLMDALFQKEITTS
jgi:hypothetical protein